MRSPGCALCSALPVKALRDDDFIADRQALGVATGWRSRLLVVAPVPVTVAPETALLLPSLNEKRSSSEEAPGLGASRHSSRLVRPVSSSRVCRPYQPVERGKELW